MPKRLSLPAGSNRYFLIPCLIWAVVGALLLAFYSRRDLFRAVNTHHSETLDSFMFALTNFGEGWPIILTLLMLVAVPVYRNWWYALTAVACNGVPALVIQALKSLFDQDRPFEYYKSDTSWIHFSNAWGDPLLHRSFPSGHSAGAFSLFCFLALLLPKRYQPWGLALFVVALGVGYSRMYLAAHFFADVYAGSVVGTLVTWGLFSLFRTLIPRFYGSREAEMAVIDN